MTDPADAPRPARRGVDWLSVGVMLLASMAVAVVYIALGHQDDLMPDVVIFGALLTAPLYFRRAGVSFNVYDVYIARAEDRAARRAAGKADEQ